MIIFNFDCVIYTPGPRWKLEQNRYNIILSSSNHKNYLQNNNKKEFVWIHGPILLARTKTESTRSHEPICSLVSVSRDSNMSVLRLTLLASVPTNLNMFEEFKLLVISICLSSFSIILFSYITHRSIFLSYKFFITQFTIFLFIDFNTL